MGNTAQVGNTIYAQINQVSVKLTWLNANIDRLVVDKGNVEHKGDFIVEQVNELKTIPLDPIAYLSRVKNPNYSILRVCKALSKLAIHSVECWTDKAGIHMFGSGKDSENDLYTIHYIVNI
jgi:hypothetical protein